MRLQQLFVNCAYYWAFAAAIGYFLCNPSYTPPTDPRLVKLGLGIFVVSEVGG